MTGVVEIAKEEEEEAEEKMKTEEVIATVLVQVHHQTALATPRAK